MSGALVAGAAPLPGHDMFYRSLVVRASAIVAADAAGEWCVALGRTPDLVVGDFDSARAGAVERLRALGAEVVTYPEDKDASDLDLALDVARQRFGGPVTLTAAFSGRFDHTLAAVGTLLRAGPEACAVEPGWTAWAVHAGHPATIATRPGTVFGVVSVTGASGVEVAGGRWTLRDATLRPLESHSISNEAVADSVRVACRTGTLVAIVSEP